MKSIAISRVYRVMHSDRTQAQFIKLIKRMVAKHGALNVAYEADSMLCIFIDLRHALSPAWGHHGTPVLFTNVAEGQSIAFIHEGIRYTLNEGRALYISADTEMYAEDR